MSKYVKPQRSFGKSSLIMYIQYLDLRYNRLSRTKSPKLLVRKTTTQFVVNHNSNDIFNLDVYNMQLSNEPAEELAKLLVATSQGAFTTVGFVSGGESVIIR